ncbi:MAG TPA: thiamine pyrophosphate-dependent enzyme [Stellaceae bacterium]|nr:thiamine pyrophosphate-dependent enzyme [Stellaceae bacterium]
MTETMNTAEAVIRSLVLNGVDRIFGLPGVQNDVFFAALHDAQEKIKVIHTRHEQGACYMALGAAMATGKPQAYVVVPGPGFLNSTGALCTAYACNAPVLALTGQIPQAAIGRGLGLLHELPDQLGIAERLSKYAARIKAPHEAPHIMHEAFRQLRSGRPRPVALECPPDVWPKRAAMEFPPPAKAENAAVDPDAIAAAAKLLGAAEKPLIVIGGGAMGAGAELLELAEMLQAPIGHHRSGIGAIDGRNPWSVSVLPQQKLWADCDVVLAVGTRLQLQQMNFGVDPSLKIVRIDADPEEIDRIRRPQIGIVADAAPALRALIDALPKHNKKRASRRDEIGALKAEFLAEANRRFAPQAAYIAALRAELPENGIFVDEVTQIGHVIRLFWEAYAPRTFLTPAYQGTLGWGVATALGAKAACPDRPVVCIAGDGGFMFNVQELASAVRHNLAVTFVVFNDNAFGNVQRSQKEDYGNRVIGSDLVNPDFMKLADSFGIAHERAASAEALRPALRRAIASNKPALIECPVGEMPNPFSILRFLTPVRPKAR